MLGLLKDGNAPVEPAALASFYRQMSGFSTTLIDLRDEFEGDMDRFLVYLIVLLDDVSRVASGTGAKGGGVSALSIAEITRIPRETVRRKVGLLVASGLLRREGYAHYHLTEDGDSPQLMERFARLTLGRVFPPAAPPPLPQMASVPSPIRATGTYASARSKRWD